MRGPLAADLGPAMPLPCLGSTVRVYPGKGGPYLDLGDVRAMLAANAALSAEGKVPSAHIAEAPVWERGAWAARPAVTLESVRALIAPHPKGKPKPHPVAGRLKEWSMAAKRLLSASSAVARR